MFQLCVLVSKVMVKGAGRRLQGLQVGWENLAVVNVLPEWVPDVVQVAVARDEAWFRRRGLTLDRKGGPMVVGAAVALSGRSGRRSRRGGVRLPVQMKIGHGLTKVLVGQTLAIGCTMRTGIGIEHMIPGTLGIEIDETVLGSIS